MGGTYSKEVWLKYYCPKKIYSLLKEWRHTFALFTEDRRSKYAAVRCTQFHEIAQPQRQHYSKACAFLTSSSTEASPAHNVRVHSAGSSCSYSVRLFKPRNTCNYKSYDPSQCKQAWALRYKLGRAFQLAVRQACLLPNPCM